MRPKFWYCTLCGYMFMETSGSPSVAVSGRNCPMCGEEATPCWECISTGVFDATWCERCENKAECWSRYLVRRSPAAL